ncbi:PAS domain S-box protein [Paludibacterium sp.]|uniref:PAS domain S-box protein n=1 Tax=Paludibacterium sp. TaxID=1917523 RepID=UPI0025E35FD4|nr:PAS domain S-box protein [Paludibacterium sp.]MBV8648927.1 PAS domain S-box protein [Paludibacterium sp.]
MSEMEKSATSSVGIITIDEQGIVKAFDAVAERLFGYASAEVIGRNVNVLMPTPYREEHDGYLARYTQTGQAHIIGKGREVRGRRKDGSIFPVWLAINEVRFGEQRFFVGSIVDLSELKTVEADLAQSLEVTRAILDTAVNPIITIDPGGIVRSFNPAAVRLFGYEAREVIGQNVKMLMPSPYQEEHDGYLARYLREGNPRVIGQGREVLARRKDQSVFPIHLSVGEMKVASGRMFVGIIADISKQRAAEQSYAASAELTRAILDTAVNPIITISRVGEICSFNPAAEKLFGYASAEVIGKNVKMLMPTPYRDEHDGYLSRYLHEGNPRVIGAGREVTAQTKDGAKVPIHLSVGEMEVGGNRMFVGIITDTSRLKETERAFVQSLQTTRAILDTAVSPIVTTDAHGAILSANPATERLFKYPCDELIGQNICLLFAEPYQNEHRKYLERYLAERKPGETQPTVIGEGREIICVRKDGSTLPIHLTVGGMDIGGEPLFVKIMVDMTEYKAVETELRKHRDHLEELVSFATAEVSAIVRAAINGIITIDENGIIRLFNPAAEILFGWSRDDMIGQHIGTLIEAYRFPAQRFCEGFLAVAEEHVVGRGREVIARKQDGATFPANVSMGHTELGDGHHFFVASISDITEQKQIENKLKKAKEEAEAGARSKSLFLANMSHEIRTPMNAVIGFAEVVLQDAALSPTSRRHLEVLLNSARSLLNIINDVLDISKLDSGKLKLEAIGFHLANTIKEALSTIEHKAYEKGLALELAVDGDVNVRRIGDPTRVRQVILNLVSNAIKFTEHGRVRVTVHNDEPPGSLRIAVHDTGIGMSATQLAHVFEVFTQADDSTTRRFGGTGLGTTICKEIVELMGGRIWAESEQGVGSVFSFIAVLPEAPAGMKCLNDAEERSLQSYVSPRLFRILLCEDIETNATLAMLRLGGIGHDVAWVKNGREGFEATQAGDYDLVLMDVMMPEMDGLEATRRIRAAEKDTGKHIPILALTASVMQEDLEHCREAGMDGHAAKPIDFELLLNIMDSLVPPGAGRPNTGTAPAPTAKVDIDFTPVMAVADLSQAQASWGDMLRYAKSLKAFAVQLAEKAPEINPALAQGDTQETMRAFMHTLKGSAGNLALTAVHQLAAQIDSALKSHHLAGARDTYPALQAALQATLDAIARLELPPPPLSSADVAPATDRALQTQVLAQVLAELDNLNPDTVLPLLDGADAWLPSSELAALRQEIEGYAFNDAAARVQRLISSMNHSQPGSMP